MMNKTYGQVENQRIGSFTKGKKVKEIQFNPSLPGNPFF